MALFVTLEPELEQMLYTSVMIVVTRGKAQNIRSSEHVR